MSDFHAAWANENMKAARTEQEAPVVYLYADDDASGWMDSGYRVWRSPLRRPRLPHGTLLEPLDSPVGQGMSQDRQDTDETASDTKPCNSQLPPHGVRIVP